MTAPTLPEFILARVAEEERPCVCQERYGACGGAWCRDDCRVCSGGDAETDNEWTLAQCAAYRRIVAQWPDPFGEWTAAQADAGRAVKEAALRALATIWADHDDFDERWRP